MFCTKGAAAVSIGTVVGRKSLNMSLEILQQVANKAAISCQSESSLLEM